MKSPMLSKQHLQANQDSPDYEAGFKSGLRYGAAASRPKGASADYIAGQVAALEIKVILAKEGIFGVIDEAALLRAMDSVSTLGMSRLDLTFRDLARREKATYSDINTHKQIG